MDALRLLLLSAAVAWFQTSLSLKSGPGNVFLALREAASSHLPQEWNPFECPFCLGFWLIFPLGLLEWAYPPVITFFGVLGIASALRGMQGEF